MTRAYKYYSIQERCTPEELMLLIFNILRMAPRTEVDELLRPF